MYSRHDSSRFLQGSQVVSSYPTHLISYSQLFFFLASLTASTLYFPGLLPSTTSTFSAFVECSFVLSFCALPFFFSLSFSSFFSFVALLMASRVRAFPTKHVLAISMT